MRSRLIAVSLAGSLVACYASQQSGCDLGGTKPTPVVAPPVVNVLIAASPTPSPTKAPESCRIDYLTLRPVDGLVLANKETATIDLTSYQTVTNTDGTIAQLEVSKACNEPRQTSIIWTSSSVSILITGGGFNPELTRVGVGLATITAGLEGHFSNSITVRTP